MLFVYSVFRTTCGTHENASKSVRCVWTVYATITTARHSVLVAPQFSLLRVFDSILLVLLSNLVFSCDGASVDIWMAALAVCCRFANEKHENSMEQTLRDSLRWFVLCITNISNINHKKANSSTKATQWSRFDELHTHTHTHSQSDSLELFAFHIICSFLCLLRVPESVEGVDSVCARTPTVTSYDKLSKWPFHIIYGFIFVVDVNWIDSSYAYNIQCNEIDTSRFLMWACCVRPRYAGCSAKYTYFVRKRDVGNFHGLDSDELINLDEHEWKVEWWLGTDARLSKLQPNDVDVSTNIYHCCICSRLFAHVTPSIS